MVTIPPTIADKLLGTVLDYLKKGGENLIKNIAAKKAIKKAIERAAERFGGEYDNKELARALTIDTKFYDLPSVQKAIRELLEHPFDPAPQIGIENEFAMVLPESQRGIANQAAQMYFEILREELIGVEKLNDKLKLIYLKRTSEATERTAQGVEKLVALQEKPFQPKVTKFEKSKHEKIDLNKLRFAEGFFVTYPPSKYHNVTNEEYIFTLINESGQDITRCFIFLDEFWIKSDVVSDGSWELKGRDIFGSPFRWNKEDVPADGKIDIDNNDRASFILAVSRNRNEYPIDFSLAFLSDQGPQLYIGWDHRLLLSIRARDRNENNVLARYYLYLRPHSSKGLEILKMEKMTIVENKP